MAREPSACRQAAEALESCALPWSEKNALRRAGQEGDGWVFALLSAKRSLLRQGAGDEEFLIIDAAVEALFEAEPCSRLGAAARSELFALLPSERLAELCARPEALAAGGEQGATPLHWICQQIGARALLAPAQLDLFAPAQTPRFEASLRACAGARPEWINALDDAGQSALHWAVYFLALEAISPLLELGADPHLKNPFGSPPFDPDFFRLYLERSEAPAKARGRAEAIWRLMERQCLLDATDEPLAEGDSGRKRL